MRLILICLLLPLGGVLSTLQMDKDMQYNCYYQILKNFSRKSYDDYEDDIEYNYQVEDTNTERSNTYVFSSTESQLSRMRRAVFKDDTSSIQDLHTNDLEKTFSSAYAEPRNSGNYKQSFKSAPRSSFNNKFDKPFNNNDTTISGVKEVTYFIVASQTLRAGFVYPISISVLEAKYPIKAFANISCDGVNYSGDSTDIYAGGSETLKLYVASNALPRQACKLRLEGFFLNYYCDLAFLEEFSLEFVQDSRMILIETDKPLYMQGDELRFRVTVLSVDYKPSACIVEVFLIDPNEHITWRWLTPVTSSGTITLEYILSDRPVFGEWTISATIAEQGGQQRRAHFTLEEYYRPRCEVEIDMPQVFFTTSAFIKGFVTAKKGSNGREWIYGNLTLLANYYPLGYLNETALCEQFRLSSIDRNLNMDATPELFKHPKELLNRTAYVLYKNERSASYGRYFMSHERRLYQETVKQFNGSYNFKWSKFELEKLEANMTAIEILVTATVATADDDELCSGYAIARIYKPTMRITFLGGSSQIFKPTLPFTVYIALDYINGSPLDSSLLTEGQMEVRGVISTKSEAGEFTWPKQRLQMLQHRTGVWELKIDLRNDFPHLQRDILHTVTEMRLQATFTVERQAGTKRAHNTTTTAELQLKAHFSPRNQYIKVATSTEQPTVGEYIIFQINSNFLVEHFHYMVIAKQVIWISEREFLTDGMRTIALVLSAEMSPFAEIFVWAITWQGQIVADSLVFPVMGAFRNNFTLTMENVHENKLPVHIQGEAGSYVSLSTIARDLYEKQSAGFGLTQETLINEMKIAYNSISGLHKHGWYMHKDHYAHGKWFNLYYPAATSGIDANSSFAKSGLIVLTDGVLPSMAQHCNENGFERCLRGGCYLLAKKCDGILDCADGSDEVSCLKLHQLDNEFYGNRMYRVNRVFRHYQNASWMWKDIQINSTGRSIFHVDEPSDVYANQWIINGYSTQPAKGLGVLSNALVYTSIKPIITTLDMPGHCRQYEHVGIYVHLIKNTNTTLTARLKLRRSIDYAVIKTKQLQYPLKIAANERQRTVLLSFMPIKFGKIAIILSVETPIDSFNITSYINVRSTEVNLQQQRGWHKSLLLNLTEQESHIVEQLKIPKIPHNRIQITLIENSLIGLIAKDNLKSSFLETAEEIALALASDLYSLIYARLTGNRQNATAEKDIYFDINVHYQRLLGFMRRDGSFSNFASGNWNHLDSSIWLTAHCLRLIQAAAAYQKIDYIWIDVTIMEANLNWLLLQQASEGTWQQKGISAEESQNKRTLTAHMLITLCTLQNLSDVYTVRVEKAIANALTWIDQNWGTQLNTAEPYEVALTTYALLLCKSKLSESILPILHGLARHTKESHLYWSSEAWENSNMYSHGNRECSSLVVETTSYALLIYLLRGYPQVESIANWLNANCLYDHGLISARAKSIAMSALFEFYSYERSNEKQKRTTVKLLAYSMSGESLRENLYFNNTNGVHMDSVQFKDVVGVLEITAKGTGSGIIHVHFDTDEDKVSQSSASPAFRINNKAKYHGHQGSHITYTSCIKWINSQQATNKGLTILDVMIPTGYGIEQQMLDAYARSKNVKQLLRAKYLGTNIIFYFIDLSEENTCVEFTIKRWYPVANMTRFLPLRVYNYHTPEHFALTVFDALPLHRLNITQVFASSRCTNCFNNDSSTIVINFEVFVLVLLFLFTLSIH